MNAVELYDISPIPRFPYEPGLSAWLAVLACAVLAFAAHRVWSKRRHGAHRNGDPLSIVAASLDELGSGTGDGAADKRSASRSALLVRRWLAIELGRDLSGATPNDLKAIASGADREWLRGALAALAELEEITYAPRISQDAALRLKRELADAVGSARRERQ